MYSIAAASAEVFYDTPISLVHREQLIRWYGRIKNRIVEGVGGSRDVSHGARCWSLLCVPQVYMLHGEI